MITYLKVDNFKGLNDFEIEFTPLTVLIGENGTGKSTVLQVLDLLAHLAHEKDIKYYLKDRGWEISELKSKLNPQNDRIVLEVGIRLDVEGKTDNVSWKVILSLKKRELVVVGEEIYSSLLNINLIERDSSRLEIFKTNEDKDQSFDNYLIEYNSFFSKPRGSFLSDMDLEYTQPVQAWNYCAQIKKFFAEIRSFELLSTEKMRGRSKGDTQDIGIGGEKLATFLHGLDKEAKQRLVRRINKYIPSIDDIKTEKMYEDWTTTSIIEKFNGVESFQVDSMHISDGLLRIIALSALGEIKKENVVMLLDEIEDDINPELAATLVNDLVGLTEKKNRQVMVTTHSPIILNYFPEDYIIFMWRESSGKVRAKKMFNNPEMQEYLEYMNAGDVWANLGREEIINKLKGENE